MELISRFVNFIFAYCTDFVINMANITGLSYYEINLIIFCFLFPVITITLLIVVVIQAIRLCRLKVHKISISEKLKVLHFSK
jgi:hypothetical protein